VSSRRGPPLMDVILYYYIVYARGAPIIRGSKSITVMHTHTHTWARSVHGFLCTLSPFCSGFASRPDYTRRCMIIIYIYNCCRYTILYPIQSRRNTPYNYYLYVSTAKTESASKRFESRPMPPPSPPPVQRQPRG